VRPGLCVPTLAAILVGGGPLARAQEIIDLPTVLCLAGAQNLDVQIARQRLAEAAAADTSAKLQFLPWLSPGLSYRGHGGNTQDVAGNIVDTQKHSYTAGLALAAQVDLGDAVYRKLSAEQVRRAAEQSVGAQQRDSTLSAATAYLELVRTGAHANVVRESVAISRAYEDQVRRAVEIGLAGKGDELRVQVQTQRYEIELRRAVEQQRITSSRLAEVLRLDPATQLTPADAAPVPLTLVAPDATLESLVARAIESRPELRRNQALVAAAEKIREGASYGPIVPNITLLGFAGGLGGGRTGVPDTFGGSNDYAVALGWRIGPGGLFDRGRVNVAKARVEIARLDEMRAHDNIVRQVAEAFERAHSLADQILATRDNLATASHALDLSQARKQFGIAAVLEVIQAQRDLTQARGDFVDAVAENDKAQYLLAWASGAQGLTTGAPPPGP
jgi:outer membrane protein TolC